jgi:hypothetical protein
MYDSLRNISHLVGLDEAHLAAERPPNYWDHHAAIEYINGKMVVFQSPSKLRYQIQPSIFFPAVKQGLIVE